MGQRTAEEKAAIPAVADASVALVAGVTASVAVAPFLMCVDRAVVSAAAGTAPGGRPSDSSKGLRHRSKAAENVP